MADAVGVALALSVGGRESNVLVGVPVGIAVAVAVGRNTRQVVNTACEPSVYGGEILDEMLGRGIMHEGTHAEGAPGVDRRGHSAVRQRLDSLNHGQKNVGMI